MISCFLNFKTWDSNFILGRLITNLGPSHTYVTQAYKFGQVHSSHSLKIKAITKIDITTLCAASGRQGEHFFIYFHLRIFRPRSLSRFPKLNFSSSDISDFGDELVADLGELVVVPRLLLDRPLEGVDPHLGLPQHGLHLGDLGLTGLLDGVQALVRPAEGKRGTRSVSRFPKGKLYNNTYSANFDSACDLSMS